MKKNAWPHKNAEPSAITLERDSAGTVALTLLMAVMLLTFAPACEAKQRAREARGK